MNGVLASLSAEDFSLLAPGLVPVDLPLRKLLEGRNRKIEHVYFLESGLASVVATSGSHHSIEVGVIGREGMTGLALVMATDRSPHETFIQSAGKGLRLSANDLRDAMDESPTLRGQLLRFGHTLVVQTAFTALSNGRYKIEERLARWLLMAHDRADGTTISLTHEFLAVMLGSRRPGITSALHTLQKQGVIRSGRGAITVLDREALEDAANGGYGAAEAELERLFPA
jgi:CRP-like cAMP-binding protein